MQDKLRDEYLEYLKKVCEEKSMRQCALDFYDDLTKTFGHVKIARDDLEVYTLYGKKTEQDVACLFDNKKYISVNELFVFLIKNNIDKMAYYAQKDTRNAVGFCNAVEKNLGICLPMISTKKMSKLHHIVDIIKKTPNIVEIKCEYDSVTSKMKTIMYHELSHVLELKTFNKREIIKNTFSDMYLIRDRYGVYRINARAYSDKMSQAKKFIQMQKIKGSDAISECLNELFSGEILNSLYLSTNLTENLIQDKYISKRSLPNYIKYVEDYDITVFLKYAISNAKDIHYRTNSIDIIDKINNIKISPQNMDYYKKRFLLIAKGLIPNKKDKNFNIEFADLFMNMDTYSTICTILGMSKSKNVGQSLQSELKMLLQEMLIDAIKNKLVDNLNDKKVPKDDFFCKQINNMLFTIDSLILYNNDCYGKKVYFDKDENVYFSNLFRQTYNDYGAVNEYAKLLGAIEFYVQKYSNVIDKDKIPFLKYHNYKFLANKFYSQNDNGQITRCTKKDKNKMIDEKELT